MANERALLYIGGAFVDSAETLESFDPASGALLGQAAAADPVAVAAAVAAARAAFPAWAGQPWVERRRCLLRLRAALVNRSDALAGLISQEVGKPVAEALCHDVLPALFLLQYYIREGGRLLRSRPVRFFEPWFLGKAGWVEAAPLGVVAVITPWNFPLSLALGQVAPALAAGNVVVLKPSEETPLVGAAVGALAHAAGLPPGVLNVINGGGAVGRALVSHPGVDKVAFTGSTGTGRAIARELAETLRPAFLELGGKDPMVVCHDADLELAARGAVAGAFSNAGQVCAAVERVYVAAAVAAPFIGRVVALTRALRVGPGHGPNLDVGPLVNARQRERVAAQVDDARNRGARALTGGRALHEHPGFWYAPTVLVDVDHTMAVMTEETFGPVLPVMAVADEEEALKLANASPYALTASVWTRDLDRGRALAGRLRAGSVLVNDHFSSFAKAGCPWGGPGWSGGAVSHGPWGLQAFTMPRTVVVDHSSRVKDWWFPYGPAMLDYFRPVAQLYFGGAAGRARALGRVLTAFLPFRRTR